jgi:hypothetical protein
LEPALARYADDFAGVYIKLKPLDIVYLLLDPVLLIQFWARVLEYWKISRTSQFHYPTNPSPQTLHIVHDPPPGNKEGRS